MRVAIVIPTLDEGARIAATLAHARRIADLVVIADGGSTDETRQIVDGAGTLLCLSPAGRGRQLARGAETALAAGAEVLVFLHADTRLPADARRLVTDCLLAGDPGGGFSVTFDDAGRWFRLGERIVNLRTRVLRMPLGDQAQFASADTYRTLGGFRPWPILEDVDFMRRMRHLGRPAVIDAQVTTSARRFRTHGTARTIAANWLIWALYLAGVSPDRLARLYPNKLSEGPTGSQTAP